MADNPSTKRLGVMLSSTSRDLPVHRERATNGILRVGMFPIGMETLTATLGDAISESLKMVEDADIYIGIFGHRYGYIPEDKRNPNRISITEMEYRRALERGIPALIFIMSDDHPGPATAAEGKTFYEENPEGKEKLSAFKDELMTRHVVGFFTSPEDLRGQIIQALNAPEIKARAGGTTAKSDKTDSPTVAASSGNGAPPDDKQPRSDGSGGHNRTPIIVALISAVALVIAAMIGIVPALLDDPDAAVTNTATVTATPTETNSATVTTPGNTATDAPTRTPQSTTAVPTATPLPTETTRASTPPNSSDATLSLETLNQWRSTAGGECPTLTTDDTLVELAREQVGTLQSISFRDLTAEPTRAYLSRSDLTMQEMAQLRGYGGEVMLRVFIRDVDQPPNVADLVPETLCNYTQIGIATDQSRASNTLYMVIVFGDPSQ